LFFEADYALISTSECNKYGNQDRLCLPVPIRIPAISSGADGGYRFYLDFAIHKAR
jgi:hypothetical protein